MVIISNGVEHQFHAQIIKLHIYMIEGELLCSRVSLKTVRSLAVQSFFSLKNNRSSFVLLLALLVAIWLVTNWDIVRVSYPGKEDKNVALIAGLET